MSRNWLFDPFEAFDDLTYLNRIQTKPAFYDRTPVNIREETSKDDPSKRWWFVDAVMPGLSRGDIEVTADNGLLTIETKKKSREHNKVEDSTYLTKQYTKDVHIKKVLTLPKEANVDNISATYTAGILTVCVPMLNVQKTKKLITVE